MGSCSSAPLEESVATTTPATFKRQEVAVAKVDTEQAPTGSSHQTAAPPGYPDASETEEYESSPESLPGPRGMDKEKKNATSKGGDKDEKPSAAQLRVGYSSGASSGSLDADEPRQGSARNHLLEIKHSISVDGDLCKAVVRIETDFGRPIEEVYDGVHDGPVVGSGVSGIVRRVVHRKTGVNYAAKCLDLGLIVSEENTKALRDEIGIMCQLDHPNIVRLDEVYESDSDIFLIQELCLGGDLFDRLDEQSNFHYSESKCARLVKQMLSAVRYLHSKNIIHRDLKLENFLFSSAAAESELRMIDFGLSKHFDNFGDLHYEMVGTPYTVAPEIINGEYDEKVDIWAMGVITYLLLSGETPFGGVDGESLLSVRSRIMEGHCDFEPAEIWDHVSDEAKAFIKRLLDPNASTRPTAKEAQRDPWLRTFGKKDFDKGNGLSPNLCQSLIDFKEYSDMRKFLCEVLSYTLLPEQIVNLRIEFEKVDPEGEGEISLATLKQVLKESAEEGSLGALTEDEVEGIFDALRVRKTEAKIRWHEFIAAGLSQCDFDDRNLRLAFDRLDSDRKGFITLTDMKGLLGTAADEEDEALSLMWEDGLAECVCPLGRITFDDFRMFVKGQKREKEPSSPIPRRTSHRFSLEMSPLQAVPEGSMSPQAKHQVFAKFAEMSALDSMKLPVLGAPLVPILPFNKEMADLTFPRNVPTPLVKRTRSRSLGETPTPEYLTQERLEMQPWASTNALPCAALPNKSGGKLREGLMDESRSTREIHQALYQKHRQFRQSVTIASKLFDQKQKARKFEAALVTYEVGHDLERRASLVMKRGASPIFPKKGAFMGAKSEHFSINHGQESAVPRPTDPSPDDSDHGRKVADASKRSGRPRRPREKTASDISGMLR